MLHMARTALRRKSLAGLVLWCIVTREASPVGDVLQIASRLPQVAQLALLGEYRMRAGERPTAERLLCALSVDCQQPAQRQDGYGTRKPKLPLPQPMRAREVHQINAPGPFFSCAYAPHLLVVVERGMDLPSASYQICDESSRTKGIPLGWTRKLARRETSRLN